VSRQQISWKICQLGRRLLDCCEARSIEVSVENLLPIKTGSNRKFLGRVVTAQVEDDTII
jgi:hypothetical protein